MGKRGEIVWGKRGDFYAEGWGINAHSRVDLRAGRYRNLIPVKGAGGGGGGWNSLLRISGDIQYIGKLSFSVSILSSCKVVVFGTALQEIR